MNGFVTIACPQLPEDRAAAIRDVFRIHLAGTVPNLTAALEALKVYGAWNRMQSQWNGYDSVHQLWLTVLIREADCHDNRHLQL